MTKEGPEPDHSLDVRRIDAALANLRKQHVWNVLSDQEFKSEYQALQRPPLALEPKSSERSTPNLDRAEPNSCGTYRPCGSIQGSLGTSAVSW
jgi:hypothetical protein